VQGAGSGFGVWGSGCRVQGLKANGIVKNARVTVGTPPTPHHESVVSGRTLN
jgi:hypothetical protein